MEFCIFEKVNNSIATQTAREYYKQPSYIFELYLVHYTIQRLNYVLHF